MRPLLLLLWRRELEIELLRVRIEAVLRCDRVEEVQIRAWTEGRLIGGRPRRVVWLERLRGHYGSRIGRFSCLSVVIVRMPCCVSVIVNG